MSKLIDKIKEDLETANMLSQFQLGIHANGITAKFITCMRFLKFGGGNMDSIAFEISKGKLVKYNGCTGLTAVTIPDSVTSIGNYAFYGCTGLPTV